MKLLCINSKIIKIAGIEYTGGSQLKEGQIYTTMGKKYIDTSGHECYFIDGIGSRLACRFTELLDQSDSEEEKASEEAVKKLKEELNLN